MAGELSQAEKRRYQRQLLLDQVGESGQERLKAARVLVVGAGGLGCPVLLYLAAAGVGTLGIIDDDLVEEHNLHRQILFGLAQTGQVKVEEAARELRRRNPECQVECYAERLRPDNAEELICRYDLVADCSDNFAARYLINDACVACDRPFVSASVRLFEGQLSVFNYTDEKGCKGPSYRCLFPEPPLPEDAPPAEEMGIIGVVPGVLGTLQAAEILKVLLGVGDPLSGRLLSICWVVP